MNLETDEVEYLKSFFSKSLLFPLHKTSFNSVGKFLFKVVKNSSRSKLIFGPSHIYFSSRSIKRERTDLFQSKLLNLIMENDGLAYSNKFSAFINRDEFGKRSETKSKILFPFLKLLLYYYYYIILYIKRDSVESTIDFENLIYPKLLFLFNLAFRDFQGFSGISESSRPSLFNYLDSNLNKNNNFNWPCLETSNFSIRDQGFSGKIPEDQRKSFDKSPLSCLSFPLISSLYSLNKKKFITYQKLLDSFPVKNSSYLKMNKSFFKTPPGSLLLIGDLPFLQLIRSKLTHIENLIDFSIKLLIQSSLSRRKVKVFNGEIKVKVDEEISPALSKKMNFLGLSPIQRVIGDNKMKYNEQSIKLVEKLMDLIKEYNHSIGSISYFPDQWIHENLREARSLLKKVPFKDLNEVLEASFGHKFWRGKITDLKMLGKHYPKLVSSLNIISTKENLSVFDTLKNRGKEIDEGLFKKTGI